MHTDVYVNGKWSQGQGQFFEKHCPATQSVSWQGHSASSKQVEDALTAAREAFKHWSNLPQENRNSILLKYAEALKARKEDLALAISRDMGKPLWESRTEANAMAGKVSISIQALEERTGSKQSDVAFGRTQLAHKAHGVMAVIGPFNFPGHLPNGHIVPALLAGNVCIFKPSELAPSVATVMVAAFEEAGLPEGCLSVVQGGRSTGQALLDSNINGLLFTGSVEAGLHFHRTFAGRPEVMLALEMGGNNPLIVWDSTNAVAAANQIFQSGFITSGQRCSCARRVILPNSKIADDITDEVLNLIKTVKIGSWEQDDVFMGPLVSNQAAQNAIEFQNSLIGKGAKPIQTLTHNEERPAYVTPGIIDVTDVPNREDKELFGPLIQLIKVDTLEAAFKEANETRFGLAAGILSDNAEVWKRAQMEMQAGILNWNRPTTGASSALPFGGPGHSGNHRPGAYYAADYCAWPQASQISEQLEPIDMPGLA